MRYIKTRDLASRAARSVNRAGNLASRMKKSLIRSGDKQSNERENATSEIESTEAESLSSLSIINHRNRRVSLTGQEYGYDESVADDIVDHPREEKDIKTTYHVIGSPHKNNRIRGENRSSVDRKRTANLFTVRKEAKKQAAMKSTRASFESFREKVVFHSRNTIRRIKESLSSLITTIASGGMVSVAVIMVICFIGIIVASPYGIFLSKDNGEESITEVIQELTDEYYAKIESIKNSVFYDDYEIIANDGVYSLRWDEMLSIYSVLMTTGNTSPTEVVTVDRKKKELLKTLLEEMNDVGYSVVSETYEEIETVIDEEGNETEETVEKTKTTLTVRLSHVSASGEASRHGFDEKQMSCLDDMLSGKYSTLWASIIGGYSQGMGIIPSNADWIGIDRFSWPLPINGTITSGFGYRTDPFTGESKFHGGLDIATTAGTPIVAADDGVVTVANGVDSWGGGYGFYVLIDHGDGYETLYGHCSSICVSYGQSVQKGEVIAYVGSTGNSTGNHLHFELRINADKTNPLDWFK